jgi:predicted lipid-binding transport protein (Tim44 family)
MKNSLRFLIVAFALALSAPDADAAKRFGGGSNLGKQRATPMQRDAAPSTPAAPAKAAPASSPSPAAPAPKPSFMSRWGGLLMGLGIGALLASMFGAQMGPMIGMVLMFLLLGAIAFFVYRFIASRKNPAAVTPRMQYAGIGSALPPASSALDNANAASGANAASSANVAAAAPAEAPRAQGSLSPAEVEPFLRVAKTSFLRLQAANDARDLSDIRDYTTPEVYAEIAMQMQDRGDAPQKTEVVSLHAQLVDDVVDGDQAIASVRFTGLIRENDAANPESFDEVWHVRKNLRERNGSWLISGIQQQAA